MEGTQQEDYETHLSTTVHPFLSNIHCHGLHCRCSFLRMQTEQYPTDPIVVRHFEFSTHMDDGIFRRPSFEFRFFEFCFQIWVSPNARFS